MIRSDGVALLCSAIAKKGKRRGVPSSDKDIRSRQEEKREERKDGTEVVDDGPVEMVLILLLSLSWSRLLGSRK